MRLHKQRVGGIAILIAIGVAVCFASANALAATEDHPYLSSLSLVDIHPGVDGAACGVTTDSHGDLYVSNIKGEKIEVYSAEAKYLTEIKPPKVAGAGPCGVAVDASGDVYVEDFNSQVVKMKPSEFPPSAATTYELEEAAGEKGVIVPKTGRANGIAVDPETQHLYVASAEHIAEYESNGALLSQTIGENVASGHDYYGVGVDGTTGDVYVIDQRHARAYVLNPTGTEILTEVSGAPGHPFTSGEHMYSIGVDQASGDFFVYYAQRPINTTSAVYEFEPSGAYRAVIGPEFGGGKHLEEYIEPAAVFVDNGASSPNKGDTFVTSEDNPHEADSVYAFGPAKGFKLALSKAGSGSGTVECELKGSEAKGLCASEYDEGAQVVLTATAASGSEFAGWSGACSGTGPCEVTMSKEQSATATFSATSSKKVKLAVSTAGSGSGTVECEVEGLGDAGPCATEYEEGAKLVLTAAPASGSTFAGWSGACTGTGACKLTMSKEQSVTATFEAKAGSKFKLAVSKTGSGSGTVECEVEGSNVKGACAGEYEEGVKLVLTATPTSGSTFTGWSGACTGTGACKLTMSNEQVVTATFSAASAKTFKLTVSTAGSGSGMVECEVEGSNVKGACAGEYEEGVKLVLTATPASGSTFGSWSGACTGTGACRLTMSGEQSVTATFDLAALKYGLVVSPTGSGSGTVECEVEGSGVRGPCASEYEEGTNLVLTATPAAGSTFAGWSGACTGLAPCKVWMTGGRTVAATFTGEGASKSKLAVSSSGSGSGSVQCEVEGSGVKGACASEYAEGTKLVLTAAPTGGSTFSGWSGACSGTGGCSLSLGADVTSVTASFAPAPLVAPIAKTEVQGFTQSKPSPSPPPVVAGKLTFGSLSHVSHGRVTALLRCSTAGVCRGTLKLTVKLAHGRRTTSVLAGQVSYEIAAGGQKKVTLKLSKAVLGALRAHHSLRGSLAFTGGSDSAKLVS